MASQDTTKIALFTAIEETTVALKDQATAQGAATSLLQLAYAWRALAGGTQPGSSIVKD